MARPTMTAAERTRLRELVNQHTRERIQIAHGQRFCIECGTGVDNHTHDCQACHDRHQRRRNRAKGTST